MRASTAGQRPAASNTARPAEKGTDTQKLDPALVRRTIDGIVSVTGCRRKEARERVAAWHAGGKPLADLEAYLRATYRLDPTGVTAVRNVASKRGGRVA